MKPFSLLILGFALVLAGCASLNSVSLTPVPPDRSHPVSAQADRWIILGINGDNDYVDKVEKDLSRQCPNGKISGILTKDELYWYFLFFVVKHNIEAKGYCQTVAKQ